METVRNNSIRPIRPRPELECIASFYSSKCVRILTDNYSIVNNGKEYEYKYVQ